MPVIVLASPKGGSGKSTTSVILATELSNAGAQIVVMDCDPNQSVTLWYNRSSKIKEKIQLINEISEAEIIKNIKHYDLDGTIVIVDLEGVASRMASRAISQADLVITPMRATTLDATIGAKTILLIKEEEEVLNRKIQHSIVFTMTRTIKSKQHTSIEKSFQKQNIDIIYPSLMERSAFSSLFEFGDTLKDMPPQGNIEAAIKNAEEFAKSVFQRLQSEMSDVR